MTHRDDVPECCRKAARDVLGGNVHPGASELVSSYAERIAAAHHHHAQPTSCPNCTVKMKAGDGVTICRDCWENRAKQRLGNRQPSHQNSGTCEADRQPLPGVQAVDQAQRAGEEPALSPTPDVDALAERIDEASKKLRRVEIHQDIKWSSTNLKDDFYRALELLT